MAERLFGGFEEKLQIEIVKKDRTEVFNLKGNRNPDYAVFGIGIRDTKRPQSASGYFLLAIALQHGALFGIETVDDLAKYDLSSGKPIGLRWKDEYMKRPVLRNVTADGPQDVPLHQERFCELLRDIVKTAGYSKSVTVHMIRKYLGSVIEGLKEYQNRWVRERRDQRILNWGKEEAVIRDNAVSTRARSLIMPEIAKISTLMSSDKELLFDEMLAFVDDLKTLSADSSFSSPPTTPGLDVIDPRIRKPIVLDVEDGSQLEDYAGDKADKRLSKALRTYSFIPSSDQRLKRRREEHHYT
ncbi:hypothetical protein N7447_009447 [Penicillium robsamsonii]|uniref:uncharacterized protein n=1 Tax=Penicillium robsamsonii TaxID=1792511 RepID=UPI0025485FBE|nr:uncharacterized protein N7447_009447 [Penicillium robsamsonii]KAJ5817214.1 hypothetical protein N7447_009447 [Penicillium robsamsonii]